MKVIAMFDCADGNESVGTSWTKSKIFDGTATLKDVMDWHQSEERGHSDVVLTIPDETFSV